MPVLWHTNREDKLARWCGVFTAKTKEELEEALGDDLMDNHSQDKLLDEVDKYSSDNKVIALYMKLPREELEKNTLIVEGEQRGRKEGVMEVAKNFKLSGFDIHTIAENTGLSIEEIENL